MKLALGINIESAIRDNVAWQRLQAAARRRGARQTMVGAGLGFRKAAKHSSRAELAELAIGEAAVRRRALIQNGRHPDYQNGRSRVHGWVKSPARGVIVPA